MAGKIKRVPSAAATPSPDSVRLRTLLAEHAEEVRRLISGRGATNPRLFGSVAAGNAVDDSDIDLMVDFIGQSPAEQLMNSAGLSVELSDALGVRVDVLVLDYAKDTISETISAGAVLAL